MKFEVNLGKIHKLYIKNKKYQKSFFLLLYDNQALNKANHIGKLYHNDFFCLLDKIELTHYTLMKIINNVGKVGYITAIPDNIKIIETSI
jgi:hypothetical protein